MRELFVYYRIRAADASAARAAVDRLQGQLRLRHPGLVTRWLRRPETRDGEETWMEVYATDRSRPEGIDPELQVAIESEAEAALQRWLVGHRHPEVFVDASA